VDVATGWASFASVSLVAANHQYPFPFCCLLQMGSKPSHRPSKHISNRLAINFTFSFQYHRGSFVGRQKYQLVTVGEEIGSFPMNIIHKATNLKSQPLDYLIMLVSQSLVNFPGGFYFFSYEFVEVQAEFAAW